MLFLPGLHSKIAFRSRSNGKRLRVHDGHDRKEHYVFGDWTDLYAFTAEGDPNSAVIVGDDGCIVFDGQATPTLASKVIERVRTVTDKPIKYVVLSHYHAVRVLGASAFHAEAVVASQETHRLVAERGKQDWDSEFGRFRDCFRDLRALRG